MTVAQRPISVRVTDALITGSSILGVSHRRMANDQGQRPSEELTAVEEGWPEEGWARGEQR
jgi:hypothetical protein